MAHPAAKLRPPLTPDEFRSLWAAGVPTAKIAAKSGRSTANVKAWAIRMGLPRRMPGGPGMSRQELTIPPDEFVTLWHSGATIDVISQRTGITRHGVGRIARGLGLPPRAVPRAERLPAIRDEFVALWNDPSVSRPEVARRYGVRECTAVKWSKSFGLPAKATAEIDWSEPQPGDPTEEEILELGAYLRARRTLMKGFNFDEQDAGGTTA